MPRLFVVVPFWNGESLLERCLGSLAEQNVPATVVLIDDGSAAPARQLARAWCEGAQDRVYLSRAQNEGPAAARHTGLSWVLEHAPSERDVIVLLDGDDELAHDGVLGKLAAVYEAEPQVKMTLGGHRRVSGKAVYRRRYRPWHFALHTISATAWRARPPRTFRVGLLRQVWPDIRWRWPNGAWLRSGTDVLLILPMLRALRWRELSQLEEVLYVYNDVRPDGETLERSLKGRYRQLCAEAYVRRSLGWGFMAIPRLAVGAARTGMLELSRARKEGRHG